MGVNIVDDENKQECVVTKIKSIFMLGLLPLLFWSCASTGTSSQYEDLTEVAVEGRQLLVNGEPFQIQGVCWNPVAKGDTHPEGVDFTGFMEKDIPLMKAAGINTVRTYEPITDMAVLDYLYENGIYVINSVFNAAVTTDDAVVEVVKKVQNHPAILMYSVGNEWNYNKLYSNLGTFEVLERLSTVTELIKKHDPSRPVATVYGVWGADLPSSDLVDFLEGIDVWGINMYAGLGFERLFPTWKERFEFPMFLAEYGADAWNANWGDEDLEAQAEAVAALTQLLLDNSTAADPENVTLGGTVFEWADEWWKDGTGHPKVHDRGGLAPGGGPHPDGVFNEEYWGIVDIDRNPRPAYFELQKLYTDQ